MTNSWSLPLPDCDIRYYPGFVPVAAANSLFRKLRAKVPWQQDDITVYGKTYPQPRLTALYGENGKTYRYSGITMNPLPFPPALTALKQKVEKLAGTCFDTCLLNLYRDGKDSNGWHSDDERELGENPPVASISLGEERYFKLRHRTDIRLKYKMVLEHGSLLLMLGPTQHYWQHQIPKSSALLGPRINLTFRKII